MNTLPVQEPWFGLIAAGDKSVEGRPCPKERWENKIGQKVWVVRDGPETAAKVLVVLVAVRWYPNLEEYLAAEWMRTAPQAKTLGDAQRIYLKIMMISRGEKRDGAPEGHEVQVFGPERVALRGGITALEIRLVPE